ncbi:MAG: hypothetical protein FJZ57_07935 [Chlamydiae bacterium]|nr:hypothetical protein [Chlamydiota bacterium]
MSSIASSFEDVNSYFDCDPPEEYLDDFFVVKEETSKQSPQVDYLEKILKEKQIARSVFSFLHTSDLIQVVLVDRKRINAVLQQSGNHSPTFFVSCLDHFSGKEESSKILESLDHLRLLGERISQNNPNEIMENILNFHLEALEFLSYLSCEDRFHLSKILSDDPFARWSIADSTQLHFYKSKFDSMILGAELLNTERKKHQYLMGVYTLIHEKAIEFVRSNKLPLGIKILKLLPDGYPQQQCFKDVISLLIAQNKQSESYYCLWMIKSSALKREIKTEIIQKFNFTKDLFPNDSIKLAKCHFQDHASSSKHIDDVNERLENLDFTEALSSACNISQDKVRDDAYERIIDKLIDCSEFAKARESSLLVMNSSTRERILAKVFMRNERFIRMERCAIS